MVKKVTSSGNAGGLALALIVMLIGVILCFTIVLAIIGIPMVILSLFMGGKRKKVWRCKSCRSIVARG